MKDDESWFGPRLKAYRERAGFSQLKLSEEMDVSLQTVRDWERGNKFPHLRRIPQLARILGVEAGQFFPSTGYAPTCAPDRQKDPIQHYPASTLPVLEDIESHLSQALGELRKFRKNQSNDA